MSSSSLSEFSIYFSDDPKVSIEISPDSTITQLKDAIFGKIQIPLQTQRLFYRGKELLDHERVPDSGSSILLADVAAYKRIDTTIWIQTEKEKFSVTIDLKRAFTCDLMDIIFHKYNIRRDHYRLMFQGKALDENVFLSEYIQKNGSTVRLLSSSWSDGAGPVKMYHLYFLY